MAFKMLYNIKRDKTMKITSLNILTATFALALFANTVNAATISVGNINGINVADVLIGTSSSAACESSQTRGNCDFLLPAGPTPLNNAGVASAVTSNPANYVLSPDRDNAYIDLGFSGFNLFNGAGNDLVVFIVGHSTSFGLDVFDTNNVLLFSDVYNVPTPIFGGASGDTVFDNDGNWLCVSGAPETCAGGSSLSAAFFDLGDAVAGDIAFGSIRISIGEGFNGADGTRPRFSLAGGFYTEASPMVVPLPMPALLLTSGLFLLGWVGRRKSA